MMPANRYRLPSFDIIHELQQQISRLESRVRELERSSTTTVPMYHKNQLGTRDLVAGQVFIGLDNTLNYVVGSVDAVTVYEVNGVIYSF